MPNRILKETICTSENIGNLTPEQEIFFYRLLVNCDDFGRFDARPSILLSRCFPLMYGTKSEADIEDYMRALIENELIIVYEWDGRPYLQIKKWDKHQTIRNKKSKFPDAEGNCIQLHADVPVIQSNPNTNPNQYRAPYGNKRGFVKPTAFSNFKQTDFNFKEIENRALGKNRI